MKRLQLGAYIWSYYLSNLSDAGVVLGVMKGRYILDIMPLIGSLYSLHNPCCGYFNYSMGDTFQFCLIEEHSVA